VVWVCALLALALIDWDTTLLPDDITLPLLWARLCASIMESGCQLPRTVGVRWRAILSLLAQLYWAFKLVTGKEAGYSDFK
jgi:leader peptidase (prepilin peptidase)/N-methyltransferase